MAEASPRVPLSGTKPVHLKEAVSKGRVASEAEVRVILLLAPETTAVDHVRRFLSDHGLDVVEVSTERNDIVAQGPASRVCEAFGVELHTFTHEHDTYHSHLDEVHVPEELHGEVLGVLGLDETPRHRNPSLPAVPRPGSTPGTVLRMPGEVTAHYAFPETGGGQGQRVAILSFGGGFLQEDVDDYFSDVLGRTPPTITQTVLHGGANQPLDRSTLAAIVTDMNDPSMSIQQLQGKYGAKGALAQETIEVTMDLQLVAAVAPEAEIHMVFAANSARGFYEAIHAALGQGVGVSVDPAHVINISWGKAESLWGDDMRLVNRALQAARDLGVTVCCASGDWGSANTPMGATEASTNFPASSPDALACGGTTLAEESSGGLSDTAWKSELKGFTMATGGGVSGFWAAPDYQAGVNVPRHGALNGPSWVSKEVGDPSTFVGRGLPDVSACADPHTGYQILVGGVTTAGCGTSAAAPIWAGLLALIGEQLGDGAGWVNARLYASAQAGLNPVTVGDNQVSQGVAFYEAAPGWNGCCGLGTPDGKALLDSLRPDTQQSN